MHEQRKPVELGWLVWGCCDKLQRLFKMCITAGLKLATGHVKWTPPASRRHPSTKEIRPGLNKDVQQLLSLCMSEWAHVCVCVCAGTVIMCLTWVKSTYGLIKFVDLFKLLSKEATLYFWCRTGGLSGRICAEMCQDEYVCTHAWTRLCVTVCVTPNSLMQLYWLAL